MGMPSGAYSLGSGGAWISIQYPQLGLQTMGLLPGVHVGMDFPQIPRKSPAWSLGVFPETQNETCG